MNITYNDGGGNEMTDQLGFISREDIVVVMTHRIVIKKKDRHNWEAVVELVDVGVMYSSPENKRYYIRFSDGEACWVYRTDIELHTRLAKRLADRVVLLQEINFALDTNNEELFNELTKELESAYYEVN